MASFVDNNLPIFSPYVSKVPIDSYTAVGAYKQGQYDQNLEKIRGYTSSVSGIEAVNPYQEQYLQHQISQLNTSLQGIAGADLSKQKYVNQVGSMTAQLAKDPVIQATIQSTANYKKGVSAIEADRKEGKLSPDNQWDYQSQFNKWVQSGDISSAFTGQYYTKVDVLGEFIKLYKEMHPDATITEDAFRVGKDGKIEINPALEKTSYEGISPEKVSNTFRMLSKRPDVSNQLGITARYTYRDADPIALLDNVTENYQSTAKGIEDKIKELRLKMNTASNQNSVEISNQIAQLKNTGSQLLEKYKGLSSLEGDQLKQAIYQNNLESDVIKSFSWAKNSTTVEANPLWAAQMDRLNYELNLSKFAFDKEKFSWDKTMDQLNFGLAQAKAAAKLDEKGNPIEGVGQQTFNANVAEGQGELNEHTFEVAYATVHNQWTSRAKAGVADVARFSGEKAPWKPDGSYNIGPGGYASAKEAQDAHDRIYAQSKMAYSQGVAKPEIKRMFEDLDPIFRKIENMRTKRKEIDDFTNTRTQQMSQSIASELSSISPTVYEIPTDKAGFKTYSGKNIQVTPEEMLKAINGTSSVLRVKQSPTNKFESRKMPEFEINTGSGFEPVTITENKARIGSLYNKVFSAMGTKNAEASSALQSERQQYFKDAQQAFIPQVTNWIPTDSKSLKAITGQIASVIDASRIQGRENPTYDKILALTKDTDDNKVENNQFYYKVDKITGKAYIGVRQGDDAPIEAEVSMDNLTRIPGVKVGDQFWDKYGSDLSLTDNTTTDVKGEGEESAYPMKRNYNSKYNVKYHLIGDGNGSYNIQLFVRDKKGNILYNGGSFMPPNMDRQMNKFDIESIVNTLKDDAVIDGMLMLQNQ